MNIHELEFNRRFERVESALAFIIELIELSSYSPTSHIKYTKIATMSTILHYLICILFENKENVFWG